MPPKPKIIQRIINALAVRNVPRERLDQLWTIAGYHHTRISDALTTDPIVEFIHQQFEKLNSNEKDLLREDLRSVVEIDQSYFSAVRISNQRMWKDAIKALLTLQKLQQNNFNRWYLRLYDELGRCFYSKISFSESLRYYEQALMNARRLKNERKQGEILIQLGNVYRRRGGDGCNVAIEKYYNEAQDIFCRLQNKQMEADCLRRSAGAFLFAGQPQKAEKLIDRSLVICDKEDYDRGIYKGWQHLAWVYSIYGRWNEAVEICEKALNKKMDDWDRIKGLRYLGEAYRLKGNTKKAKDAFDEALKLFEKFKKKGVGSSRTVALTLLGLAKLYIEEPGQEFMAEKLLEEGFEMHGGLGEDFRAIEFIVEQGRLSLKLGRLEDAEARLKISGERYANLRNTYHYIGTLSLLCKLNYERGTDSFDEIYKIASDARKEDNGLTDHYLSEIEFIVGKTWLDKKQFSNATEAWYTATEKALNYNVVIFKDIVNKISSEIVRVTHEIKPNVVIQILNNYISFLEHILVREEWDKNRQKALQESIILNKKQSSEINALITVE